MRPIKLEIEGLNSFETKQVLDFSELAGGVFGIFGKTGSGKSTILDAITLSLYGKVERSKQNIDFINTKCQKANVSFEFEIFVSGKNSIYKINRTFSRKKNGKDIDSDAELFEKENEDYKLISEGTTKVNDKIFSIIGLGVNEFAKCIALPQGEFSAFLQAKPTERTEIMSNIFNLSEYGEDLYNKVKEKLNEFDKQVSVLSASSEMLSYANDEMLKASKENLENNKNKYDENSKKLQELSNSWAKLKQDYDKLEKLEQITKQLSDLDKEKEKIEKLKDELSKSQAANQMKSDYDKLKKDENDIKQLGTKLSDLNEQKLQKQSKVSELENSYSTLKETYNSKVLELNTKLSKLEELVKFDEQNKDLKQKQTETEEEIIKKESELAAEKENNAYLEQDVSKLQQQIEEIDEFINTNKADVELSYALEQTKGVESELLLIDDMYKIVEKLIDQTNQDLKAAQDEYNEAIAEEKKYQLQRERIEESIGVAFEDADSTNFNKLRSCDKQIEGMNEVKIEVERVDELILKLTTENENRMAIIEQVEEEIAKGQQKLSNFEDLLAQKEVELDSNRNEREEMLGENVISMISEHLNIGDLCPVCSSEVTTKIYSEKNDLGIIENEIEANMSELKNMRFERDKILADIVSLKSRIEFEKSQIESNKLEMKNLHESKNRYYQKFVDNNDQSSENFEKLYALLCNTINSLEELISLQEETRENERFACVSKAQAGTKISIYKNYLESLIDTLYDLQKKKAEREFVIINVNEKYANLSEYKKQIADGKNIELKIDTKKDERAKLKDTQFEVSAEKSKSDLKIANLSADISLLNEKLSGYLSTISENDKRILSSGVPEGASVETEKLETEKALATLKVEYENKQSEFETSKEELNRIENDYAVSTTILTSKQEEFDTLTASLNKTMTTYNFSGFDDLESCFADSGLIKIKQEKIDEFDDTLRVLQSQKAEIENEKINPVDKKEIAELETQINELNEIVKQLSESVGKFGAEYERVSVDNSKLKQTLSELETYKHKYDLAKELSTILRGKALAEYVCEEYLQQITSSANQKLDILMDGRYTLKFENKEFFVEDNFNDGKVRPASTLSGGETFVVSLSLALSISDAIAMLSSRSMDFFFLDEGFGTLDSELCSVVVSSLYKLESQNLKIGLISHVAELEESIKNRVIVTKEANGTKLKIEHSL